MYKIMLADDEGIVTDSIKFIIEKNYPEICEIQSAKTGRSVIELAETFKPDVVFMDIQMPGINGIDAMKEIRKTNSAIIFIVMSAYDKFDYAKEAINLGVLDYLNKPFSRDMIVGTLDRAMKIIDTEREKRRNELQIREKIETVVPVIESGFIYSLLFQENYAEEADNYKALLGIDEENGFMMVLEAGDQADDGKLTNPVGAGIRTQAEYQKVREMIKGKFNCAVGPLLSNKIICFIPCGQSVSEYNERVSVIEKCEALSEELFERTQVRFRVGIGSIQPVGSLSESYRQALEALKYTNADVAHARDLPVGCEYDEDYPIDQEQQLFAYVEGGDVQKTSETADRFFDWMEKTYPENIMDIRLKCLEFVLWAEHLAYLSGGMTYHFTHRSSYLPEVMGFQTLEELRLWFVSKMTDASRNITVKKEEKSDDIVSDAKEYIAANYSRDISLDDVSRNVDVSPYYFTRLFKEETGVTFVEYLTTMRIDKAKEMLNASQFSMKEICQAVGYSDPNYFSRIFKKNVGVTPTEYRTEKGVSGA